MSIYIIHDYPLIREALALMIQRIRPTHKVIQMAKLSQLEGQISKHGQPELVCLSLQLSETQGLSGIECIKSVCTTSKLMVMTVVDSEFEKQICLDAGVDHFIDRSCSPNDFIEAVKRLLPDENGPADTVKKVSDLRISKRQRQLLLLLDAGLSNRELGTQLNISEHTVKVHLWRLFQKMGVNSRTQALHQARTGGLLTA